jgi:V-type H+-transporting ATPase subunit d
LRSALEETDYDDFMKDEATLDEKTIDKKCLEKLAGEFKYIKAQAVEPLATFLDFIAREKMIDNLVMLIQGNLNNKNPKDVKDKINPIGEFDQAAMNMIMQESVDQPKDMEDLYRIFFQDCPIGPYMKKWIEGSRKPDDDPTKDIDKKDVFGKSDLEIMRGQLKKAWLEDFHEFVTSLGGTTAEVMGDILKKEADFRVLLVTLNALNTKLSVTGDLQLRNELFPSFGYLYPEGTNKICEAYNESTVQLALQPYNKYAALFDTVKSYYSSEAEQSAKGQSMEDLVFKENSKLYEMAFEQQYHFGVFYAWVKLREQEIRNIVWTAKMIALQKKDHIETTIVPIFQSRI